METYMVRVSSERSDEMAEWCENHISPKNDRLQIFTTKTLWKVHNGSNNTYLFEFLRKDDATFFKLSLG
jgi:hypothetical protein